MAEIPNTDYIDDELATKAIALSALSVVAGGILTYWFSGTPSEQLVVSIGLVGTGLAGVAFFEMYRQQPNMTPRHMRPYLGLKILGVILISNGVGRGYMDVGVGIGFFVLMSATVLVLAHLFTYKQ